MCGFQRYDRLQDSFQCYWLRWVVVFVSVASFLSFDVGFGPRRCQWY